MLIQLHGFLVYSNNCQDKLLGPLLIDGSGIAYVFDIELKEAFPLSDYPESHISRIYV